MLADLEIHREVRAHRLGIHPFAEARLQPASYDLTLGGEFQTFRPDEHTPIDPRRPEAMDRHWCDPGTAFRLGPDDFALAHCEEMLAVPETMGARVEGKSSLARIGIAVHFAGFVDPGFVGQITLEIKNLNRDRPVLLIPGMAIAQIAFHYLGSAPMRPYGSDRGSHYQHQLGATSSRVHEQVAAAGLS